VGLDTCEEYRSRIAKAQQPPRVRVAGLYNSGTNAFTMNLGRNFEPVERSDYYSVPWGKHMLPEFRSGPFTSWDNVTDPDLMLPLVLVRDPLLWMKAMVCKMELYKYCHLLPQIILNFRFHYLPLYRLNMCYFVFSAKPNMNFIGIESTIIVPIWFLPKKKRKTIRFQLTM
jgi:hypothetical protein